MDVVVFMLEVLLTCALLFLIIYFLITLSDLECDYLNATECCSKLNFWNVPKLWVQLIVVLILFISGHWWLVLAHVPICVFLLKRFFMVPRGHLGEFDPAVIHESGCLKSHLVDMVVHLLWQLLAFFVFLFCLLDAIMSQPIMMEGDGVHTIPQTQPKHFQQQTPHHTVVFDNDL